MPRKFHFHGLDPFTGHYGFRLHIQTTGNLMGSNRLRDDKDYFFCSYLACALDQLTIEICSPYTVFQVQSFKARKLQHCFSLEVMLLLLVRYSVQERQDLKYCTVYMQYICPYILETYAITPSSFASIIVGHYGNAMTLDWSFFNFFFFFNRVYQIQRVPRKNS